MNKKIKNVVRTSSNRRSRCSRIFIFKGFRYQEKKASQGKLQFISEILSILTKSIYALFLASIFIGIFFLVLYSFNEGIFPNFMPFNISGYYLWYYLVIISGVGIFFIVFFILTFFIPAFTLLSILPHESQDVFLKHFKEKAPLAKLLNKIKKIKNNLFYFVLSSFVLYSILTFCAFYFLSKHMISLLIMLILALMIDVYFYEGINIILSINAALISLFFVFIISENLPAFNNLPNLPIYNNNLFIIFAFIFAFILISLFNAGIILLKVNKEKPKIILMIIFLFFILCLAYLRLYKIPFRILKFGDYEATLFLDKNNPICPQKNKINGSIIFSIGSQYIIKPNIDNNTKNCLLYNGTIIRIPKKFVLEEIIEPIKDSKSSKKSSNKEQKNLKK